MFHFLPKKRLILNKNLKKILLVSVDAVCSIKSHIASFYDVEHLLTIDLVLFLDIHMQIFVPPNIYVICGLVCFFLYGLLLVSGNTDHS